MPNHAVCSLLLACALTTLFSAPIAAQAEEPTPPPTQPTLANRLPAFHEWRKPTPLNWRRCPRWETLGLFKTAIGPQLGIAGRSHDRRGQGAHPTMSRELLITDLNIRPMIWFVRSPPGNWRTQPKDLGPTSSASNDRRSNTRSTLRWRGSPKAPAWNHHSDRPTLINEPLTEGTAQLGGAPHRSLGDRNRASRMVSHLQVEGSGPTTTRPHTTLRHLAMVDPQSSKSS